MTVARAVEGIEPEAIVRACQAFTAGEVSGQSLDYAPAVPRFVKECRQQQAAMEYARRPKLQHKPALEHSDEHRAEMQRRLAGLSKTLAAQE